MLRRLLLVGCLAVCGVGVSESQERPTETFDRAVLVAKAAEIAKHEHVLPARPEGEGGERLTYDQYRSIRYSAASIWTGEGRNFTVDLFYPGFIYEVPVNINLVVGKTARRVLFKNDLFDYAPNVPLVAGTEHAGYSGFRVRAPLDLPERFDEFLVFQGASYFRGVARGQVYGLSARGLAVLTARPEGEEFPVFTDFWIVRPAEQAEQLVIHALLQSPSVVGAYSFTAQPGEETVVDVEVTLFPRVELTAFGVAPLTSMFLFDASNRARFDDYRDAVHDSDGLQIVNGRGERLWRPLGNPRTLQVSAFLDDDPKGFGLLQRKRRFADYEDDEARYDQRPSLWVEPGAGWGPGHVELVEIPSDREMNDNIVAYWQPREPVPAGKSADFSYRLRFTAEPLDASLARVVSTRIGRALDNEGRRSFVIDFEGADPAPEDLVLEVSGSAGEIFAARGHVVADTGAYRASFELDPNREDIVELRAQLHSGSGHDPWSEIWLYRWSR